MHVTVHHDARPFLADAGPELEAEEAANGLLLGVAAHMVADPQVAPREAWFAVVREAPGAALGGVLMSTPTYFPVIHVAAEGAQAQAVLARLEGTLFELRPEAEGVNGRVPWGERLGELRRLRTGRPWVVKTALRAFVLTEVAPPRPAPGVLRAATQDDAERVIAWFTAFEAEALGTHQPDPEGRVGRSIVQGRCFLWEAEGRPVSTVSVSRSLPHGDMLAAVYTPPEARGQGYASNAVAELSQRLLARGRDYVTLFTDLANPTSNHIYQAVGFRPLCDYAEIRFL